MLTADQVRRYRDQGYLVVEGFWSAADVVSARQRAEALLAGVDAESAAGVFSTLDHRHSAEARFLESGHVVRAFFEEEAVDANGRLLVPAARAVNKFGHALHRLDPVFSELSRGPRLQSLAAALGLQRPERRQSMLIVKQPDIGGEVRWHQDATYFFSDPITVTTFWWAVEDADTSNGCLWVLPGGHHGPLRERFVVDRSVVDRAAGDRSIGVGAVARLVTIDPMPWPLQNDALAVPVPAGSLVLMHGLLPHRSDANRSKRSRLAYTLHVTDGGSRYASDNWLQPLDPAATGEAGARGPSGF